MPELPDYTDLGQSRTPRPGGGVASADLTGPGRGLADFGRQVAQAGEVLAAGWESTKGIELEQRFHNFKLAEFQRYADAVGSIEPGQTEGFAVAYRDSFVERVNAEFSDLPEAMFPRVRALDERLFTSAFEFERTEQSRVSKTAFDDSMQNSILPDAIRSAGDATSDLEKAGALQRALQDAYRLIDADPTLSPIERDERRRAASEAIQLHFAGALPAESRTELDPSDRGRPKLDAIQEAAAGFDVQFPVSEDSIAAAGEVLNEAGFEATPRNLLLMHMLGPQDAVNLIGAEPGSLVGGILSKKTRDQWGDKLRNADGLTAMTVEDVLAVADAQMEGVRAVEWGEAFDALTPAQKLTLAADGAQALIAEETARKKAAEEEFSTKYDALYNFVLDNAGSENALSAIHQAYGNGDGWLAQAPEKRRALINLWQEHGNENLMLLGAAESMQQRALGIYDTTADPDREAKAKAIYKAAKEGRWRQVQAGVGEVEAGTGAIASPETPDMADLAVQIADTFQYVPPDMMNDIVGGLWSTDMGEMQKGWNLAQSVLNNVARVRQSFTDADMRRFQQVDRAFRRLPEEERAAFLRVGGTMQDNKRRDDWYQEALHGRNGGKALVDDVTITDVLTQAGLRTGPAGDLVRGIETGEWFLRTPVPVGRAEQERAMDDWRFFAATYYSEHGDWEAAQEEATEMWLKRWSRSTMSGEIQLVDPAVPLRGRVGAETKSFLTDFPAELYHPTINGSHDYIRNQFEEWVLENQPEAQGWALTKHARTEQVVRHNERAAKDPNDTIQPMPVPYSLIVINERGVPVPVTTENGTSRAFFVNVPDAIAAERALREADEAERDVRRQATEDYFGPPGPTQGVPETYPTGPELPQ